MIELLSIGDSKAGAVPGRGEFDLLADLLHDLPGTIKGIIIKFIALVGTHYLQGNCAMAIVVLYFFGVFRYRQLNLIPQFEAIFLEKIPAGDAHSFLGGEQPLVIALHVFRQAGAFGCE